MRQQLIDFTPTLRRQACKNVLQVSRRVMPIEPRRLDQTHDRRRTYTATSRASEHPVRAPKSPRPDLVLAPVVIDGHSTVIEIARQRNPALKAVIQRLGDGRSLRHKLPPGDHPGMTRCANVERAMSSPARPKMFLGDTAPDGRRTWRSSRKDSLERPGEAESK